MPPLLPALEGAYLGDAPARRVYLGDDLLYESPPTLLTFTTAGNTFSPEVELHPGSTTTVVWEDENGTPLATGLTPSIDFGAAPSPAYPSVVLADAPWGFWQQGETGTPLANTGTGGTALAVTGTPTYAASAFDATAHAVTWPAGATYAASTATVGANRAAGTLECWFRLNSLPATPTALLTCAYGVGDTSGRPMHLFIAADGRLGAHWGTSASLNTQIQSAAPVTLGVWHHVTFKAGGGVTDGVIRLDGVDVAAGARGLALDASARVYLHTGGAPTGATDLTNGGVVSIAYPAVWWTRLADSVTDAHYAAGVARTPLQRTVVMAVQDPEGVRVVNLGFNDQDDNGRESMPATYNKAPEQVVAVDGLQYLSGLVAFLAANGPLAGHLDLSGCSTLEYVECFDADLTSIDLTGCASLVRLCVEGCNLTTLDLNPVAGNLRDFRAARMQSGVLALTSLTAPLASLWHFCVRSQALTGRPAPEHLPVVEQYWAWNAALTGTVKVASSVVMDSVILSSPSSERPDLANTVAVLDVSGNSWGGGSRVTAQSLGTLTDLNLTGTNTAAWPRSIRVDGNVLPRAEVDEVLTTVNAWGTSGGTLLLQNNRPPSVAVGQPAITALTGRGWTVTTDTPEDVGATYWSDDFERANGAPGSPWQAPLGSGTPVAAINAGRLTVTGGTGYQRCWAMPSGVTSDNYTVSVTFTGTPSTMTNFGVLFRMSAAGAGDKCFFLTGTGVPRLDGTATASTGTNANPAGTGVPASWAQPGTHTLAVRVDGVSAQVYCDGALAFSRTASTLVGAGRGVGVCGVLGAFPIDSITITPI